MTKNQIVENKIRLLIADGKEHSIKDIELYLAESGVILGKNSSLVRSIMSKMYNNNVVFRPSRGVYALQQTYIPSIDTSSGTFKTFLPTNNKDNVLAINILENGHINLNGKLNALLTTRKIEIQFTTNCKMIRLIPNGNNAHQFTKSGTAKNNNIVSELKRHRIALPAHYVVHVDNDSLTSYVGILN